MAAKPPTTGGRMFARIVVGTLALCLAALIAAGAAALMLLPVFPPEIPLAPDAKSASFDRKLAARGETLAMLGACASCHTREGGAPYAGGRALATPFGTIYSSNITPDVDKGIGGWTLAAFTRAMREGVSRDGTHLYPAFPYDHFARVTDEDVAAIYAYFMRSVDPAADAPPVTNLGFPFNIRQGLALWKAMYLPKPMQNDPAKDAEWNRGAYLAEGLGHCGACHTPRNLLGAVKTGQDAYGGALVNGWYAPALNKASPAPVPWTTKALVNYLMDGWDAQHGIAGGSMTAVVNALRDQNEDDVFAIAAYVMSLQGGQRPQSQQEARERDAKAFADKAEAGEPAGLAQDAQMQAGARVFAARCAECHKPGGRSAPLALGAAAHLPDPINVVRATMEGIKPPQGSLGRSMTAFGQQLSDAEIAAVTRYVRARFSAQPAWSDVDGAVARARGRQ
ncbi:MAG: putative alcohol dehydrogenase cytochrome c subunit [Hyphomicrobiales bacterium]|nr:putative alcohol dehydrogenase cytochrome c subunit [Hyphomicrobiales bacterium]